MNSKSRVLSLLNTTTLDFSITNLPTFKLTKLNLLSIPEIKIPTNLRLGHLAEKLVSELIKSSSNYNVIYENVQIIEHKKTIGEIDFIIEDLKTNQIIHLELAYKFYLFDPNISSESIKNWIGPNRNDSLIKKLKKINNKQFPLLYHKATQARLSAIQINKTSQALCLLASLYTPYNYKENFNNNFKNAIKGYYLSIDQFISLDKSSKSYYLPLKKEWGMEPSENENWLSYNEVINYIKFCLKEKQAPLCWQKHDDIFNEFFIVWW